MSTLTDTVISMVRKEARTLKYQVKEDGVAKNISTLTPKFTVKAKFSDATPLIGPVTGTYTNDGSDGKFEIALTGALTDKAPFEGVYELTLEVTADGSVRNVLSRHGGAPFHLVENIYD